jgi:hypothetical protein
MSNLVVVILCLCSIVFNVLFTIFYNKRVAKENNKIRVPNSIASKFEYFKAFLDHQKQEEKKFTSPRLIEKYKKYFESDIALGNDPYYEERLNNQMDDWKGTIFFDLDYLFLFSNLAIKNILNGYSGLFALIARTKLVTKTKNGYRFSLEDPTGTILSEPVKLNIKKNQIENFANKYVNVYCEIGDQKIKIRVIKIFKY